MPNWVLTRQERESLTATSMLKDPFTVDMKLWTPFQTRLIKRVLVQRSSGSSFTRLSSSSCASKPAPTGHGWAKCAHGGVTITISMCASAVRREAWAALAKLRSPAMTAAGLSSTTGSRSYAKLKISPPSLASQRRRSCRSLWMTCPGSATQLSLSAIRYQTQMRPEHERRYGRWIIQPARHHRTKSYVTERSAPAAV